MPNSSTTTLGPWEVCLGEKNTLEIRRDDTPGIKWLCVLDYPPIAKQVVLVPWPDGEGDGDES
jgi:hypothetical protein